MQNLHGCLRDLFSCVRMAIHHFILLQRRTKWTLQQHCQSMEPSQMLNPRYSNDLCKILCISYDLIKIFFLSLFVFQTAVLGILQSRGRCGNYLLQKNITLLLEFLTQLFKNPQNPTFFRMASHLCTLLHKKVTPTLFPFCWRRMQMSTQRHM